MNTRSKDLQCSVITKLMRMVWARLGDNTNWPATIIKYIHEVCKEHVELGMIDGYEMVADSCEHVAIDIIFPGPRCSKTRYEVWFERNSRRSNR